MKGKIIIYPNIYDAPIFQLWSRIRV